MAGGLFNLRAFKSAAYSTYCASAFLIFLGLYTRESFFRDESGIIVNPLSLQVLTYADVSAISIGISQEFSAYFISFINASSLFGRFAAGSVADRFGESFSVFLASIFFFIVMSGAINVMIPFTSLAGVLTYAWPFARTESSFIAVIVIYGFVMSTKKPICIFILYCIGSTPEHTFRCSLIQ